MSNKKKVIIVKTCIKGFLLGVIAMPIWTYIMSCGVQANGLDPKDFPVLNRFWINEIIAGFIGIGCLFLINWTHKKKRKSEISEE